MIKLTCFLTSAHVYFSDLSATNFIGPKVVAELASPPLPILLCVSLRLVERRGNFVSWTRRREKQKANSAADVLLRQSNRTRVLAAYHMSLQIPTPLDRRIEKTHISVGRTVLFWGGRRAGKGLRCFLLGGFVRNHVVRPSLHP